MTQDKSLRSLEIMLGRYFRPAPKPKAPPQRLYRVGWWKPVTGEYRTIRHTYSRFTDEGEAIAFAALKGGNVRAERWVKGQWQTIPTQRDEDIRARMFAEYYARKEAQS